MKRRHPSKRPHGSKRVTLGPANRDFRLHPKWVITLLVIVIVFATGIRLRLLQLPLERDEGEFAYAGQLILHGVPPYRQVYNMKLPGVYASYALLMAIFGRTVAGVHLGLILVNSASIVLVFLLARRLFDALAGLVAAATFALLSVSPSVVGVAAHATHFVVLPALGGMLLLLRATEDARKSTLFLSGTLFGLAFVMKQPAIAFVGFGGLYLVWTQFRVRPIEWSKSSMRVAVFSLGAVVPFGVTCLIMFVTGVFKKFWFWTFAYASQYVSEVPASKAPAIFWESFKDITRPSIWLWLIAGAGFILLWWDKSQREKAIFVSGLCIFSLLAVTPGFYFRSHYFIVLLPAAALLTGAAVSVARTFFHHRQILPALRLWMPIVLFVAASVHYVNRLSEFFFELSPHDASRVLYGITAFPESVEIAKYIADNSAPTDRIAVLGSEPQIYFYANRPSATGYIYTFGLMEQQKYALQMQQEMINEIETSHPGFVVYVRNADSWFPRPNSERMIFTWMENYCSKLDLVGVADILDEDHTVYRWGNDAKNYSPRSQHFVFVYKARA